VSTTRTSRHIVPASARVSRDADNGGRERSVQGEGRGTPVRYGA
jgi:hypothetical protein